MKANEPDRDRWTRLVEAARRVQPDLVRPGGEVPPGFTARILASRTDGGTRPSLRPVDLWNRVIWWGAGLSAAACLGVLLLVPSPTQTRTILPVPAIELPTLLPK